MNHEESIMSVIKLNLKLQWKGKNYVHIYMLKDL